MLKLHNMTMGRYPTSTYPKNKEANYMDKKQVSKRETIDDTHCSICECKGKVSESATMCKCESYPVKHPGYAKIPVVLSEFTVEIDVESIIKLCEPAIEIKRIKKNLCLKECRLVAGTNKLFLKGFVRKNIEYATRDCETKTAICGDIKHTTVYVPFSCITSVKFCHHPKITPSCNPVEINYLDKCSECTDNLEHDMFSEEFFNERVYCELEHVKIYEADIVEEYEEVPCHPYEHEFKHFTEKEVICLTLKLLQKHQVYDFKPGSDCHHDDKNCEYEEIPHGHSSTQVEYFTDNKASYRFYDED